jgi:hypothetical protein
MERNNKAKEDFEKLFKEIYEDKILITIWTTKIWIKFKFIYSNIFI